MGHSAQLTQGHSLSSRFFAFATRATLEKVDAKVRALHPHEDSVPSKLHGAGAYEDDGHVHGEGEKLLELVPWIQGEYKRIGIEFNLGKFHLLTVAKEGSPRLARLKELAKPLGITISPHIAETLGFLTGDRAHVEEALLARLDEVKKEMWLTEDLESVQDQFALLKYTLNGTVRTSHLARTIHPAIGGDAFRSLDDATATTALRIAGIEADDVDETTSTRAKTLALLAGEFGGAGLGRIGGVQRVTQYVRALHNTLQRLKKGGSRFLPAVAERRAAGGLEWEVGVVEGPEGGSKGPWGGYEVGGVPPQSVGREERELLPVDIGGSPTTDSKATRAELRTISRQEGIITATRLLDEMRLPANKNLILAASVLSGASSESAIFLQYCGGPKWGAEFIGNDAFMQALRMRLLLPPLIGSHDGVAPTARKCTKKGCCPPVPLALSAPADTRRPHAALTCDRFAALTDARHDCYRDLFWRRLRVLGPTRKEERTADGQGRRRRSDVEAVVKGKRWMIDVVTTTASTPARCKQAAFTAGWAAARAEQSKHDKYWDAANPNRQAPLGGKRMKALVPVAMESGGLMGEEAKRWLRRVFKGDSESLRALYRELSFLRARKVGEALWLGTIAGT